MNKHRLFLLISLSIIAIATGAAVSVPNTFQAGQTAVAADVNENFTVLTDALNERTIVLCQLYAQVNPGDPLPSFCPPQATKKYIFATSTTYDGNMGGLAGADSKCQGLADASSLPTGVYKAWLSSTTVNAEDRLSPSALPYVKPDDVQVAADWNDLVDGNLDVAIDLDQSGTAIVYPFLAWTATDSMGMYDAAYGTCADWSSDNASSQAAVGFTDHTAATWSNGGASSCGAALRLYCIQQ